MASEPDSQKTNTYESIMAQADEIEAPCDPGHYRVLKRIASNPDNYVAVGCGGGSVPGLAGNSAMVGLLDDLGIRPYVREVWGTSAGSVVGGAWATGASKDEGLAVLESLNRKGSVDVSLWDLLVKSPLRFLFTRKLPDGLVRGKHFREGVERSLKVATFEESEIPFRAIAATDDGHARKVILRSGPIADAIMASMCLPGISVPVPDWTGRPYGYLDGGIVEKTPLVSIVEEHARLGRPEQLVVLCTHFADSATVSPPRGFLQRFLHAFEQLETDVWEHQLQRAREAPNCKFIILNPRDRIGGMLEFKYLYCNYLLCRKMFKQQLSNAGLGTRFAGR